MFKPALFWFCLTFSHCCSRSYSCTNKHHTQKMTSNKRDRPKKLWFLSYTQIRNQSFLNKYSPWKEISKSSMFSIFKNLVACRQNDAYTWSRPESLAMNSDSFINNSKVTHALCILLSFPRTASFGELRWNGETKQSTVVSKRLHIWREQRQNVMKLTPNS